MTDDIVKRLRKEAEDWRVGEYVLEAADEIERLREALKTCITALSSYEHGTINPYRLTPSEHSKFIRPFLLGALDCARAALEQKP